MKRLILILLLLISLCGCKSKIENEVYFYSYFDTVSLIKSYKDDEATFERKVNDVEKIMHRYHEMLDTFNDHDVMGLYKLNEYAGEKEIVIDEELFDFLVFAKEIYYKTNGKTNVMMGALTNIWKKAISEEMLPNEADLKKASEHINIESLVLDKDKHTAYIDDKDACIDVGGVAKGYVCKIIKEELGEDLDGYSISLGGNVILFGTKGDGSLYKVGVKDPFNAGKLLDKFELSDVSLVTSGNYERYFELDGRKYHHIIDSSTLYPSFKYASVTIVYDDSSIADAFSTALFCLDVDESKRILANYPGIQAILVTLDGEIIKLNF